MKRMTLCAVILSLTVLCSACSASPSYDSAMSSAAPAASEAAPPPAGEYSYEADEYISPGDGVYGGAEQESALPLLTQNDDPGSKMVYTVSLDLQTTAFDDGTRGLLTTVREMGGYVVGAHVNGRSLYTPDAERWAQYTLRVPSERLADFLVSMEDNYNLWQLDQRSQDIARQHTQTELNLDSLREQEARLLETLGQTEDPQVRADIEGQLRDIQSQIASSTATKAAMEKDVTFSTVTVQLYEVFEDRIPVQVEPEVEPDTFGGRLGNTAARSWNGFVGFCQGLLLFVIAVLPALVVIGVIVVLSLLVYRQLKKRGLIKSAPKPPVRGQNPGRPDYEDGPPQN